eukprot:2447340-Pleurochrysis_carterae.AAC.1
MCKRKIRLIVGCGSQFNRQRQKTVKRFKALAKSTAVCFSSSIEGWIVGPLETSTVMIIAPVAPSQPTNVAAT